MFGNEEPAATGRRRRQEDDDLDHVIQRTIGRSSLVPESVAGVTELTKVRELKGSKRQRRLRRRTAVQAESSTQTQVEDDVDFLEAEDDVVLAFESLRARCMDQISVLEDIPPIVLRSQLYATVSNRASVDRGIELMRKKQSIRVFSGTLVGDELALVRYEDYVKRLEMVLDASDKTKPAVTTAVNQLLHRVVPQYSHPKISKSDLYPMLHPESSKKGAEMTNTLVGEGLLLRTGSDDGMYSFAIPSSGKFWKSVRDGAKDLSLKIKRKPYHEIALRDLETSRVPRSIFDASFHVKQMVGSGQIEIIKTTSGRLARLTENGKSHK